MLRARLAPPLLALALVFLAAPVQAVDNPKVVDVLLLQEDETPWAIVPKDEMTIIRAVVNNTGDTATNGSLVVRFVVADEHDMTWTFVARKTVTIDPGNETTIDYRWPTNSRQVGNHSVTITILGAADPGVTAFFDVAETGVEAGSIVERTLDHYWFFGLFLVSLVLFFVVLAARKS
ncbi:MAG: hypothetical protein HYT80_10660 [Euryarchaeota archaeon]|nr:hypothetical protein [Euryarchaeota archaeon]